MSNLDHLEPRLVWKYFLELSKIPRGSKNELAAAQWVVDQGRAMGFEVKQDSIGNVLIYKPGTPGKENHPTVCIQAHVDMVCEKTPDSRHDFTKDPIQVYQDGDVLKAKDTTLGADNGIGVAMGLAALASKDIPHGPLEFLVTVQEETGLDGALALSPDWLKAKYMLNIDSEVEKELYIGCAGGVQIHAKRPLAMSTPKTGTPFRIKVTGLKGGHSGMTIHEGQASAVRVLAQVVNSLSKEFSFQLANIQCPGKHNAIPREATATLFLNPSDEARLKTALTRHQTNWRLELGKFDPELTILLEKGEAATVMSDEDYRAIITFLLAFPNGVEAMSPDIPGLVQTSSNLGVVEVHQNEMTLIFCLRSPLQASKEAKVASIGALLSFAGFTWEEVGPFPGWQPNPKASLVGVVNQAYKDLFGEPMILTATHGGLECGLIGDKYPSMEMISIGPDQHYAHTTKEQVGITSTARIWDVVKTVLARL